LLASQSKNSPVILGVSEGAAKYQGGFNTIVGMVKGLLKDLEITIPVALHLDHGTSFESCKNAIDAGFTSVMIDGSHMSIEENVEITTKVVEYASRYGVSVEAEVGIVGGDEDGIKGEVKYASLEECKLISVTGIDSLAASLGSVHGEYKSEPNLGFAEMKEISGALNLPLVLHGGSGIPEGDIKKAIQSGQTKINVNTELQQVFTKYLSEYFTNNMHTKPKGYDPRKVLKSSFDEIQNVVKETITIFGSENKNES